MVTESPTPASKRRKTKASSKTVLITKPAVEHGWIVGDVNISKSFQHLQDAAVELFHKTNGRIVLETSCYEFLAIQNILLLRPGQNSEGMIKVFSKQLLDLMHKTQFDHLVEGCPSFTTEEVVELMNAVDKYQTKEWSLKKFTFELIKMTLELDDTKAAVVNAIRRLVEKLPMKEALDPITSETEVWSWFADPVLSSIMSSPQDYIYFSRTNVEESVDERERPVDFVVLKSQSRWGGGNYGHGVVKIAKERDDYNALVWDLCRLANFNKTLINSNNTSQVFAFQIKGYNITFYITELAHDGLYTMCEVGHLEIPHSVATLDTMVTPMYLRKLIQVTYLFEKVKRQAINGNVANMKRDGSSLSELQKLLSPERDLNLPCTMRF